MSRIKQIKNSEAGNFFIFDVCCLVDAALYEVKAVEDYPEQKQCLEWWNLARNLALSGQSRIYIPDLCISEAFKVIAKKYYREESVISLQKTTAEQLLRQWISMDHTVLRQAGRSVPVHDISTNRDIIISTDRFLEVAMKNKLHTLSIPDLIVAATAKYLQDFFGFSAASLHVVTNDSKLAKLIRLCPEFSAPIEPRLHSVAKVIQQ